ncbi:MAG: CoA transferase [Dehalococcoidales bacterium]|nr:CoA transferase [Dehalococcoidales bacterium]
MKMALEGIKVIDISQVIAVPVSARHLADFGADVIHVENPQTGDSWRGYLTGVGGSSGVASDLDYNWENWNRNKRSLAVDLRTKKGQEIVHRLVAQADIVVTNLRLWEKEKYHVDYATLKKINPKIIYGTLTGFGVKGPDNNLPAYDQTAHWYRSGVAHMLTPAGIPAVGFRAGFGDSVAGMSLFAGVMTALYHRERTGIGQEVELSLFHTGIYQISYDVAGALVTGRDYKDPPPVVPPGFDPIRHAKWMELVAKVEAASAELSEFNKEGAPNPLASSYRTRDNRIIFLNMLQPERYWTKTCQYILQKPELEQDPRFATQEKRFENHMPLYFLMRDALASRTLEQWKPILSEAQVPYSPQQKLSEVVQDPQARSNNYFVPMEHPSKGRFEVVANPINLSETPATYRVTAPEFSQHTEEVLLEAGYSWEDIALMKEQRIIP